MCAACVCLSICACTCICTPVGQLESTYLCIQVVCMAVVLYLCLSVSQSVCGVYVYLSVCVFICAKMCVRACVHACSRSCLCMYFKWRNINLIDVHPQVNMKLNQEEGGSVVKTLLHLQITDITADVKDRSWDTSATVGVGDIAIFDHVRLWVWQKKLH